MYYPSRVHIPYLPVRCRKVLRFMGGSLGPGLEVCGNSGLRIPMVPHFHQSIGNIKRKQGAWRVQKYISLIGAEIPYLPVRGRKVTSFMGGSIGPRMEIRGTSVLPIPMVPRLHQSKSYTKRKLLAWRVQKCVSLVGADTVLTSTGPKIPRFMGGSIRPSTEICGILGLQISIVPRLHQSNGSRKRKRRH